jgi:5-methyltetrahydrofolate--homocysteine methyltransferase
VVDGGHAEIEALVKTAIAGGEDLNLLINDGLIAAMDVVGQQFADNKIFVPEMLVSAVTMKKGLEIIKPLLINDNAENKATVLIGTVKGDMHDINKNLVSMMMEEPGSGSSIWVSI